MTLEIKIAIDDLSDGAVIELLLAHRQEMLKYSPAESVHALDVNAMKASSLTFWSASIELSNKPVKIACLAFNKLDQQHLELKSMKVSDAYLRQGIGRTLLNYVLAYAKRTGYQKVSLETGSMNAFVAARRLYESVGFAQCPPFSNYVYDQNSVCMSLNLVDLGINSIGV
ncbi:MAG: putative acetyltransferase [Arenicella sp.]|jgi:putative acetyltransferase